MTLTRWALRRVLFAAPVVLGITTLTFTVIHLAPGDPLYLLGGDGGSPAYYDDLRTKFGLDRPLVEQFVLFVRAAMTGDLGHSFTYDAPVVRVIAEHAVPSVLLSGSAFGLALAGGVGLALLSTLHGGRRFDAAVQAAAAIMYSAPVYWTGQVLIIVVAVHWGLLPVGGMTSARHSYTGIERAFDVLRHLVLPAVALSMPLLAVVTRIARASLADALTEPFTQAALARGLSRRRVVIAHAAPHMMVALVTLAGQHAPQIVAGAAITEYLFGWPGLGSVILHASLHRDFPLVTSAFLMISSAVVLANAAADAVCAWLDPRIRLT